MSAAGEASADGPGVSQATRSFFRIVESDPPTLMDFVSHRVKKGEPTLGLPAELLRLWDGLSVYDSKDYALRRAKRLRRLGRFVAEVRIAEAGPVRYEKTTKDRHYYTLWGDAEEIRQRVTRVVAVE